jgi:PIN domain
MLRGAGGPAEAHKRLLAYLDWANAAVQMLAKQISDADLHVLVLTKRYEQLLSGVGIMWGTGREFQRAVIDLVDLEVNQRVDALESAIKELEAHKERWANVGDLLVLDTNFYVEHPDEVQDADLARVTANTAPGWGMHVLVPLLVVDELDRLKRDNRARSRARTALKTLNQVFANVSADRPMGRLRHAYDTAQPDGNLGLGPVTMELLFDPPDHERLPDNDAEIVDRALAVQAIAGQPVTMVTYDTSMSFRARQVGLKDLLLTLP